MAELKKQLGLLEVFSIASGAMISSGLFVLPALAFAKAGPAMIVSYFFASLLILPSLFSKAELSTAMPKAGGAYFYVERSLGPVLGVFSGLANWFSQALKAAFAMVGMAVFVDFTVKSLGYAPLSGTILKEVTVGCCILFTIVNLLSVKHTGRLQSIFVFFLLLILTSFVIFGVNFVETEKFMGFTNKGWTAILQTSGLVFISFGGLTKVASIAEEVERPARNLVFGMILAWSVVSVLYVLVIFVTVGVSAPDDISGNLMPISIAARNFSGIIGFIILSSAAILAYITTANGGILAASRSPLAMSRDNLLPKAFSKINKKFQTPHLSILFTSFFMIIAIIFLDLEKLVKTASTLILLLFILENLSVIIMRESKIQSYRPGFKSPLYPYIHIIAVIAYSFLLIEMGRTPLLISAAFVLISAAWYLLFVAKRVNRAAALMHVVERIAPFDLKAVTLEDELTSILMERDQVTEDRFDKMIKNCPVLDVKEQKRAEGIFREISEVLEDRLNISQDLLYEKFMEREEQGSTVVQPGLAIPHIVIPGENKFDMMLIRAKDGILFPHGWQTINIIFVLLGTKDQRNYHLKALMAIAQVAQEKDFEKRFLAARDVESLRNLILLSKRKRESENESQS